MISHLTTNKTSVINHHHGYFKTSLHVIYRQASRFFHANTEAAYFFFFKGSSLWVTLKGTAVLLASDYYCYFPYFCIANNYTTMTISAFNTKVKSLWVRRACLLNPQTIFLIFQFMVPSLGSWRIYPLWGPALNYGWYLAQPLIWVG